MYTGNERHTAQYEYTICQLPAECHRAEQLLATLWVKRNRTRATVGGAVRMCGSILPELTRNEIGFAAAAKMSVAIPAGSGMQNEGASEIHSHEVRRFEVRTRLSTQQVTWV